VSQFEAAGGIRYGKGNVRLYRTYARPLTISRRVPESSFTGRPNILFANDVDVHVFGDSFLPAYTEGDNSAVVATDTMKNFMHAQALAYDGSTLEGFLEFLGGRFLETYPSMEWLRLDGREEPFVAVSVPSDQAGSFEGSDLLFARRHQDHATASLDMHRDGPYPVVTALESGHVGLS